ncbi:MAG: hypothetical protein IPJ88_10725 [Myxococcales bacterium]|nr:MAG: hypothetical protein IPJ88_10725 [Myxococcales bacterium]
MTISKKQLLFVLVFLGMMIGCGGGPDPVNFGLSDAPACELSADCPEGSYCELGICYQECSTKDSCSGGDSCSERGRCSASGDSDDPPVQTQRSATLSVEQALLDFGTNRDTVTLTLISSDPDIPVRYRLSDDVPWLQIPDADRLSEFTDQKEIELTVDRAQIGEGAAQGFLSIYSYAGDVLVPVTVQNSIEGMYRGVYAYEDPGLGQLPIRMAVRKQEDGSFDVLIDPEYSLGFLEQEDGAWPGTSMQMDDDGVLSGSVAQAIDPAELVTDQDKLFVDDRTMARSMAFSLSTDSAGLLQGQVTERWYGLLPQPFNTSAQLLLVRESSTDLSEIVAAPEVLIDEAEYSYDIETINIRPECRDYAESLVSADCSTAGTSSEMNVCGTAVINNTESPENRFVAALPAQNNAIEPVFTDLAEKCLTEIPESLPMSTVAKCIHNAKAYCAQQFGSQAYAKGNKTAGAYLMAAGSDARVQAAIVFLQERILQAYRAEYQSTGSAARTQANALLTEGRSFLSNALIPWTREWRLPLIYEVTATTAEGNDYKFIRNLALLLSKDWNAADYQLNLALQTRWNQVDPQAYIDGLRSGLDIEALHRLPIAVALAHMAKAQGSDDLPHLFELGEAFSAMGRKSIQMLEHPDSVFGKDANYVPFIYDARQVADRGATNLAQLLSRAADRVADAIAKDQEARDFVYQVAGQTYTMDERLLDAQGSFEGELIDLCGGSASAPDIENCGSSGGALAGANLAAKQSATGIVLAEQRVRAQRQRILAQTSRLQQVNGIRKDALQFVSESNNEIIDITERQNSTSFFGNLFGTGLAVASGIARAVAGDPSGLPGALTSVADTYVQNEVRDLEAQKEQLRSAKELKLIDADRQVEYINGMTQIKELRIGAAELRIEQTQAAMDHSAQLLNQQNLSTKAQFTAQQYNRVIAHRSGERFGGLNDPTLRMLRDEAVIRAMEYRERAREAVFDAAKAFEYEINATLPGIYTDLIPAFDVNSIEDFFNCLKDQVDESLLAYGAPQAKTMELSLKEDILKIRGSIIDPQTEHEISAQEQFQRLLFKPGRADEQGEVSMPFETSLSLNNGAFSTGLCNDFVTGIRVKLIGDGLGDDQATVRLVQRGVSFVRSCESPDSVVEDIVNSFELAPREAEIDAGVNTYRDNVDTQFFGRSVASSAWEIVFPSADKAPENEDLDLSRLEDIVFELQREAVTLSEYTGSFAPSCN